MSRSVPVIHTSYIQALEKQAQQKQPANFPVTVDLQRKLKALTSVNIPEDGKLNMQTQQALNEFSRIYNAQATAANINSKYSILNSFKQQNLGGQTKTNKPQQKSVTNPQQQINTKQIEEFSKNLASTPLSTVAPKQDQKFNLSASDDYSHYLSQTNKSKY